MNEKFNYFYSIEFNGGYNFHGIVELDEIKNNIDLQNFKNNILKMLSSEGVLVNGDFKIIAFNKI